MPDAPAANRWTWLISLSPALNSALSALVGIAMGVSGYAGLQGLKAPAVPLVIQAADPPRPTPIVCEQQFHDLGKTAEAMQADLTALRKLIVEHFPAPPKARVVPSKTKAAQVLK